ncbi:MAG TPA: proline--tRNA ligase [Spirochaetales bacterium]|nr:proline--tRNA ligase [Spirochaetales bacterium]
MLYSRLFTKTFREVPQEIKSPSTLLLLKGGFIRPMGQGLYGILPLGLRVLRNIERIIREEMNVLGGQELSVPLVTPREYWKRSGRDFWIDKGMVRFMDRYGKELVISPTHEEAVVEILKSSLNSYRDLPLFLYQFQLKFRDEEKPRQGLIRAKEFLMKDGYSFHRSYADLNNFFPRMYAAYMRIFNRCGVPVIAAEAGVGYMGGERSFEFLMPFEHGDDTVVECTSCDYKANRDVAIAEKEYEVEPLKDMEEVRTPGCSSMEALSQFLGVSKRGLAKTMAYQTPQGLALAVVRGDYEVNIEKLRRTLNMPILGLASSEQLIEAGFVPGYLSPLGISAGVVLVVDDLVANSSNLIYGGNKPDIHFRNVNYGRDYDGGIVGDISGVKEGSTCRFCGQPLKFTRCLELGHIFKLGDYYSRTMELSFQEERGNRAYPFMGAYGIGVERLMAAVVEANQDERGIVWPVALAPFRVFLLAIGKSVTVRRTAMQINESLKDIVLYDDREESPGVKFKDADILGIPLRIVVSAQGIQEGYVEVRERRTGITVKVEKNAIMTVISDLEKGKLPV